jgi:hypothetical protein
MRGTGRASVCGGDEIIALRSDLDAPPLRIFPPLT